MNQYLEHGEDGAPEDRLGLGETMVVILEGNSEIDAHVWSRFQTYQTCSELPSNLCTSKLGKEGWIRIFKKPGSGSRSGLSLNRTPPHKKKIKKKYRFCLEGFGSMMLRLKPDSNQKGITGSGLSKITDPHHKVI